MGAGRGIGTTFGHILDLWSLEDETEAGTCDGCGRAVDDDGCKKACENSEKTEIVPLFGDAENKSLGSIYGKLFHQR